MRVWLVDEELRLVLSKVNIFDITDVLRPNSD